MTMTISQRKQIFKALVQAQDEANDYEYKEQIELIGEHGEEDDSNRPRLRAGCIKISDEAKNIMRAYEVIISKQYRISANQLAKISLEGLEKNWPLD